MGRDRKTDFAETHFSISFFLSDPRTGERVFENLQLVRASALFINRNWLRSLGGLLWWGRLWRP